MLINIIRLSRYILCALIANAAYGVLLYFVFTWLAGYSLLYAYLGNLALIILILAIDEYTHKILQSEKFIMKLKKEKDPEKSYRSLEWGLSNFGSFKTDLYLFYVFILVFSQIIEFHPSLVGDNLGGFIRANSYSILFFIAFDTLLGQYSKDRKRMKEILATIKKSLDEIQD